MRDYFLPECVNPADPDEKFLWGNFEVSCFSNSSQLPNRWDLLIEQIFICTRLYSRPYRFGLNRKRRPGLGNVFVNRIPHLTCSNHLHILVSPILLFLPVSPTTAPTLHIIIDFRVSFLPSDLPSLLPAQVEQSSQKEHVIMTLLLAWDCPRFLTHLEQSTSSYTSLPVQLAGTLLTSPAQVFPLTSLFSHYCPTDLSLVPQTYCFCSCFLDLVYTLLRNYSSCVSAG